MTVETNATVIAPKHTELPPFSIKIATYVTWTTTEKKDGGRFNKIPTNAAGYNCNAHDPKNHRTLPLVLAAFERAHGTPYSLTFDKVKNKIAGIAIDLPSGGLVLGCADDGEPLYLIGLDFDNVKDNAVNIKRARAALKKLPGQYCELSPSGTGLRVFVLCRTPVKEYNQGGFEVYSTGRFLTVTLRGRGEPTEVPLEVIEGIKAMYLCPSTSPIPAPTVQAASRFNAADHSINDDVLATPRTLPTMDELSAMLACLPTSKTDGCDNRYWFNVVSAVRDAWDGAPAAKQVVRDWCIRTPAEFIEAEFDELWNRRARSGAVNAGIGTIVHEARQRGYAATHQRLSTGSTVECANLAHATVTSQPEKRVKLVCGSGLTPSPIDWLWLDWLARGKLHIVAGAPGQGKTTIAMSFAATVTIGGRWPDGTRCTPGNVVIWSGEDDPTDTLLPRLIAAGADRSKVFFVDGTQVGDAMRPFDPSTDTPMLQAAIEQIGSVSLIIIDPISTAVAGDSHKNTEVRRGLQPLVDLAASVNAALLGITHLSKGGQGADPASRVIGSIAFTAVARVVLVAAKVKTEDGGEKRILARGKSNIGPDSGGFEYHLEQVEPLSGIQASRVGWGQPVQGSALELLADAEPQADTDQGDAVSMLKGELSAHSWTSAEAATKPLRDAGFSKKQIYSATKKLSIQRQKNGMAGGWEWRLSQADDAISQPLPEDSILPEGSEDSLSQMQEPSAPSREPSASPQPSVLDGIGANDPLLAELDALMSIPARPMGVQYAA